MLRKLHFLVSTITTARQRTHDILAEQGFPLLLLNLKRRGTARLELCIRLTR